MKDDVCAREKSAADGGTSQAEQVGLQFAASAPGPLYSGCPFRPLGGERLYPGVLRPSAREFPTAHWVQHPASSSFCCP